MRPSFCVMMGLLIAGSGLPRAFAETTLQTLRNNPFSRPEILQPKPPPPPPARAEFVVPPEDVELVLSATMVSELAPMAVVDGQLLAIGDEVKGMKLISVQEGRVIFARDGRKFSFEIEAGRQQ